MTCDLHFHVLILYFPLFLVLMIWRNRLHKMPIGEFAWLHVSRYGLRWTQNKYKPSSHRVRTRFRGRGRVPGPQASHKQRAFYQTVSVFTARSYYASAGGREIIILSVRPSVCTRMLCDETKELVSDILILYQKVINKVFCYQQRLVYRMSPSICKLRLKWRLNSNS